MNKNVIIFGSTTLAKLALFYAKNNPSINVIGFVVDAEYKICEEYLSLPVYTWPYFIEKYSNKDAHIFMAIGYKLMTAREKIYHRIKNAGFSMINIISDASYISDNVEMKDNNIIMPGAVLEPGVVIGQNNIIWSNATICHDTIIGNHNFFAANVTIGGEVAIGSNNFFGFSSSVLQYRRVGNQTVIGAHSMVNVNTQDLHVYYGTPAKKIIPIDTSEGIVIT